MPGISDVSKLDCNCKMNEAIDSVNAVIKAYNDVMDPINDSKDACLKAAKMDEYPTATALVLLRGVMVGGAAATNMKWDDIKDSISLTIEEPYLDLGKLDKWSELI